MWFQITFFSDRPSVLAVIAEDCHVYFKASDVGRFLGYLNATGFANRYAKKDFNLMIPRRFIYSCKRNLVFSFEEMVQVIYKTRHNHRLPCSDVHVQEMKFLWTSGRVPFKFPTYPALRPKFCPHLFIQKDGECCIQEWIRIYTLYTCNLFSDARKADGVKLPSSSLCSNSNEMKFVHSTNPELADYLKIPPASVPSFYISSPPPSPSTQHAESKYTPDESLQFIRSENVEKFDMPPASSNFENNDESMDIMSPFSDSLCAQPDEHDNCESKSGNIKSVKFAEVESMKNIQVPSPSKSMDERLIPSVSPVSEKLSFGIVYDGLIQPPEQVNINIRGVNYEYILKGI